MPSGGVPCEHRAVTRRYLKEASRPLNVADSEVGRRVAELLAGLCDLRIPLSMTDAHCQDVVTVIRGAMDATPSGPA